MPEQTPQLSPKELKQLRDHYAAMKSARLKGREEGKIEGIEEEKLHIAARMIHLELEDKLIQASTGLPLASIQDLRAFLKQGGHLDDFPFST